MWTRQDRKRWLNGRKVHASVNDDNSQALHTHIACSKDMSLACGWAFHSGKDLRHITCKKCRVIIKRTR